ncbi:MAG: hypothetical protein ABI905_07225 [Betaproteobacteria bacterium]
MLLAGGLIWLAAEYAENRARPSRMKVPAEAELSTVTGKAMSAHILERKTKKGALVSRYTELEVQAPEGMVTVRINEPHNERVLTGLGGEIVTVKFDRNDNMNVYSLKTGDKQVFSYGDTAAYNSRRVEGMSGNWPGWIAVVLGAIGLWISRKAVVPT